MIPDPIVTFDNGQLHVVMTAVDGRAWSAERIHRLGINTCEMCKCRLHGEIETLCVRCAKGLLEDCEREENEN